MEDRLEQSLLLQYGPDAFSRVCRSQVLEILTKSVFKCFPAGAVKLGQYGSLPLETCLRTGDIDITILAQDIPSAHLHCILLTRVRQEFEYLRRIKPDYKIEEIAIIEAEVPILKLKIKKVSVDITVNQVKGLGVVAMFEEFNQLTPNNLLKRSIVLAKIWGTYFGRILGAMYGGLTTYALEVLILFIINTVPQSRISPVHVLRHFITFFADFDWESNVVTFCKVLSVSEYISVVTHRSEMFRDTNGLVITPEQYSTIKEKLEITGDFKLMPLKNMNIMDPFQCSNNLGRSVSHVSCERIKAAFQISFEELEKFGIEKLCKSNREPMSAQIVVQESIREKENIFSQGTCEKKGQKNRKTFRVFNTQKNRIRT